MKNIQFIRDAVNCTYDIFVMTDNEFDIFFPDNTDISFIGDVYERHSAKQWDGTVNKLMHNISQRRIKKCDANGVHGILFFGMDYKRSNYPSRVDEESPWGSLEEGYTRIPISEINDINQMKYVQVINDAMMCRYDIMLLTGEEYSNIFQNCTDIVFIDELFDGTDLCREDKLEKMFWNMWARGRIPRINANGISGTLFYDLPEKKKYYPTRKDEEAMNPDGSRLRALGACTGQKEAVITYDPTIDYELPIDIKILSDEYDPDWSVYEKFSKQYGHGWHSHSNTIVYSGDVIKKVTYDDDE